jgi:hypothetical protein
MSNTKCPAAVGETPLPPRKPRHLDLLVFLTLAWVAVVLAHTLLPGRGSAPARGAAEVGIGPFVVVLPGTETPFPIQVGPAERIPSRSWVRIAGLPVLATLSEGYVTQPGVWKVPVAALPTLKLRSPPMEGIRTGLTISLLAADGAVVSEARTALAVMPAAQSLATRCDADGGGEAGACEPDRPAPAWLWQGARREAEYVMRLGNDALARGSIGAARSIYRYAALEMRWPPAALALAATYDRYELELIAPLVPPDDKEARKWYAWAQEIVGAQLSFYLQRLEQPKTRRDPPQ